jgi:hypothetical protein
MNHQPFQKKLSKIAALTDNGESLDKLSALERDLLLGYIRELYDIALDFSGLMIHTPKVQEKVVSPVLKEVAEMPHDATSITVPVETAQPLAPLSVPQASETPATASVASPVVHQAVVQEVVSSPVVKTIPEMPHDATSIVAPLEVASAPATKANVVALHSDAVNEIFAIGVISDLSDKLANSPISDLNKVMGINERMFTQQELFGNDAQAFNDALKKLNAFGSFEEARQYLIDHIIYTYDWTADVKIKKAVTFVRLVRRRYL